MDNELFGHNKGAFTGAVGLYRGHFEQAAGGTLFLDEMGELPLESQARLLRVLEERMVRRLGGGAPIPVDFRLITATQRNLAHMVEEGTFREDLYHRLAVVSLRIPPLRERKQDIPLLAQHFADKTALRFGIALPLISEEELGRLCAHSWPGNVRELQNVVTEAMALCLGKPLRFWPETGRDAPPEFLPRPPVRHFAPFDEWAGRYLAEVLEHCGGRVQGQGGAAQLLGLPAGTLRAKLRKYDIPFGRKAGSPTNTRGTASGERHPASRTAWLPGNA
jgi:DNA-binding NtrC family response regulator